MLGTLCLILCAVAVADDGTLEKKIQEMESRHEKEMEAVTDRLDELETAMKEARKPKAALLFTAENSL